LLFEIASTVPAILNCTVILESTTVSVLIALLLSTTNPEYNNNFSGSLSDSDSDFCSGKLLTIQIGLECSDRLPDIYIPGTVPEHLYKHVQLVYNIDNSSIFVLDTYVFVPTIQEIATIEAEANDSVLTDTIEAVRKTIQSGRHMKPSFKIAENQAQQLVLR
jgi:hypothetical protein